MKELSLEEIKQVELEILHYIDKVCKENGITYYLDCGTLLGAVRHQGFIPWDDDIDILVPRKDYEKLFGILKDDNCYKMIWYKNSPNYPLPYAKVCDCSTITEEREDQKVKTNYGVFVDIFPLDNYPDSKIVREMYILRLKMNRLLWAYAAYPHKNNSIRNVVCNVLVRYKKPQYYAERINKIVSKYGRHNTKYCRNILGIPRPLNLLCDREWYAMVEQRKFE